MKNAITGWGTTLIGLAIMIAATLDFFGIISVPAPEGMTEMNQVTVAFVVGLILFIMPKTFLEDAIKKVVDKKVS